MSTPTLGPSLPLDLPTPPPLHLSSSYTSVRSHFADTGKPKERNVVVDDNDVDEPELHEFELDDLPYSDIRLDARKYRHPSYPETLLSLLRDLRVPHWTSNRLSASNIKLERISGALTNAVFFLSYSPTTPSPFSPFRSPPTLVLRIYGPSSSHLISRPSELRTLHVLSSQYNIGPRVYGTFANGRVEQFFPSRTLTPAEVRERETSAWIGMRMAELHSVDLARVVRPEDALPPSTPGVFKNVETWLPHARDVLALLTKLSLPPSHRWAHIAAQLDLPLFERQFAAYKRFLSTHLPPLVFAHNDAQYGNLLRLTTLPTTPGGKPAHNLPPHHQLIVVDFEYASPNPAAFDIANHFHEWCADYTRPPSQSWHLVSARYPTPDQRRDFLRAYLGEAEVEVGELEREVREWSAASHAMWAVWGVVQARDDVVALGQREEGEGLGEFDYLRYAEGRMEGFRREVEELMG